MRDGQWLQLRTETPEHSAGCVFLSFLPLYPSDEAVILLVTLDVLLSFCSLKTMTGSYPSLYLKHLTGC